jgi:methanogenic corrinoid protein MtbC1
MSLLLSQTDPKQIVLAQQIFDEQFSQDPKLNREMDERRKQLMFQDILYNFSFLSTAVHLEDEQIFSSYALWLYELLCNLMKDLSRSRVKDQMLDHYHILKHFTSKLFPPDNTKFAELCIERACLVTESAVDNPPVYTTEFSGPYSALCTVYLDALMRSNTAEAIAIIQQADQSGLPLEDLFEQVITPAMHEVGERWHQNKITVDKEHYCTSTTQMVLSLFYPKIFSSTKEPVNRTVVTCCVGSELHEMGGRMVSDLFEYRGWDSIYLGAAVPVPSLLHAIDEYHPHLVSLSVTMPQYLDVCRDAVYAIREARPSVRIAVGGRAFTTSNSIYDRWPIDVYALKATELISWAEHMVPKA